MKQAEDKGTGCFNAIATFLLFPLACYGLFDYALGQLTVNGSIDATVCAGAFVLMVWFIALRKPTKRLSQDTTRLQLNGGKRK